jgi:signal transduction histidine kinase
VLVAAVVVAGLSVVLVRTVHDHLLSQVDTQLVEGARYVDNQLAQHHLLPSSTPNGQYGQLFLPNGTLLGSSQNLRGAPPLIAVSAEGTTPRLTTIATRRYGQLRVLETQLGVGNTPILVEAVQINQIAAATDSLAAGLAIGAPVLVLAGGVLMWFVVGRAMRTVESVRIAVTRVSDDDPSERVSNPRTGDELERLVVTMNNLLDRLQEAIARERKFVADASHEVRSPIAAIRAILESEESTASETAASRLAALGALQRLQDLADQLLILDGAGRRHVGGVVGLVDVDELVLSHVERLRRTSALEIDVAGVSGGQVRATELDVVRVIENLATNAVHHARSKVSFSVCEENGRVELTLADDGPGVPADMREAIFERFLRLDSDRGRTSGGSGLGLAIVSEIASKYGGCVVATDADGGGALFVLTLPASVGAPDRDLFPRGPAGLPEA